MSTRARKLVQAAVESRGYSILDLSYEHAYDAGEMMGYGGGWSLELDRDYVANTYPGNDLYGMSVEELLASIDYWLKPPEPCGCDREHNAVMAAGIINDPQKTTHDSDCKWHIRYRLSWWPTPATAQEGGDESHE